MGKKTPQKINIGDRHGHWVVVGGAVRVGRDTRYLCLCCCGLEKWLSAITLRNGTASSCGCIPRQAVTRWMDPEANPTPPEIQTIFTLISQGFLPPADQFSLKDGAPSWTLPTIAHILGITTHDLIQHLKARNRSFNPMVQQALQTDFVLEL